MRVPRLARDIAVLTCCGIAFQCWGAQVPLTVALSPDAMQGRSCAPRSVQVKFISDEARLIEGRLEITIKNGNSVVGRHVSHDMALTTGEQTYRLLLPALWTQVDGSQCEAHMRFVTKRGTIDLGSEPFMVPALSERRVSIAATRLPLGAGKAMSQVVNSLRLERFNPVPEDSMLGAVHSSVAYLRPVEFPESALFYCAFDIVIVFGGALADLTRKQLDGLFNWLRAGGSVCVLAADPSSIDKHGFINRLVQHSELEFSLATEPPLEPAGSNRPASIELRRCALGRIAIVPEDNPRESVFDEAEWRQMAAYLWKMNSKQTQTVMRSGKWDPQLDEGANRKQHVRRRFSSDGRNAVYPQPPRWIRLALELLTPKGLRLVPVSVLATILVLFVIVIGPIEYFVLGHFRIRPLTWVVFPLTCVVFTFLTIKIANHYLGSSDYRAGLRVLDIDDDGRILRQHRFELSLYRRQQSVRRLVKRGLFANVSMPGRHHTIRRRRGRHDVGFNRSHEGHFPYQYHVVQEVAQWDPRIARITTIGPSDEQEQLKWKPPADSILRSGEDVKSAYRKFNREFGGEFDGSVYVLNKHDAKPMELGPVRLNAELLKRMSASYRTGYFSIVTQISPTGDPYLEDMNIFDQQDPRQWLWVFVWKEKDDIFIARWLHTSRTSV